MARPGDARWLRELYIESSLYSVGHGRDISNEEVRRQAGQDLDQVLEEDPCAVLVAFEVETRERMGFLVLNLGGQCGMTSEPVSLIDSLGVEPRFWGTPTVSRLVKKAAQVTHQAGIRYMLGFVSEGNRRTLLKAIRLGFEVEQYHLAMACGPEGPETMPGRSEEEKAHEVSRAERRAQRSARGSSEDREVRS